MSNARPMSTRGRFARSAIAGVGCAALLATAAACGKANDTQAQSSGGGDTSCVTNSVLADELPKHLPADYTPLSKAPEKGGRIIYVGSPNVTTPDSAAALKKATAAIGWTSELINFDGTVEDFNAKMNQAIDQKPTAIMEFGFPVAAMQGPLKRAKDEGVIVAIGANADVPEPGATVGFAAATNGAKDFEHDGKVAAEWILKDSGCAAHVAVVGLPYPILELLGQSVVKSIKAACDKCSASYSEIQTADIGTPAGTTAMISTLQANPHDNYIVVATGGQATGLSAAMRAAGITDVKVVGLTVPDVDALAALQDGSNAMWLDATAEMGAWTALDSVLRVLDTKAPVSGMSYPVAVLTEKNVPADAKVVPTYPLDYESEFLKLWHVSS